MPNMEALKMAEDHIREQLGTLDDLPNELANTIVNVYYKFYVNFLEMAGDSKREFFIPKSIKRESGHLQQLFKKFMANQAEIATDLESAPKFIKGLRGIDKYAQPNLYKFTVEFILDCLKYNIENAQNKTGLRRMIERKFKKPDEIPNLIDLMNFSKGTKTDID